MSPTPDYFALLDVPRSLSPNAAGLRRKFYAQSALHHPDRMANAGAEAQSDALQKTALLNEALRVLSHPMLRLAHVLTLEGHPLPENYTLPPAFMMEMMELNELAEDSPEAAAAQLAELESEWQQNLEALTTRYESGERGEGLFKAFQEAYFRKKYLERAKVNPS